MAQFRATIKGNRGTASRLGTKKSGITARINGWNIGARVDILHDEKTGKDKIYIYATSGSNGAGMDKSIATLEEGKL